MGDYPLTRLGSTEFEHMTQSLLVAALGPFAVKVYGAGRDGGRELVCHEPITVGESRWTGYTVAQAKFMARPGEPAKYAQWLRGEIRAELEAWVDAKKNRQPKPDNLLFVSNAPLSAVPGYGLDYVEAVFADYADRLPLKQFAVWHYDHVCRLLDGQSGVRAAYAGLITSGDVLTELQRVLLGEAVDLGLVLHRHSAQELVAEQWVRLGNAGAAQNERLQLGQVGVDLRARLRPFEASESTQSPTVQVIKHVLQIGDSVLRPSIHPGQSPHLVLVGGPGQGKTTIGQLIGQIYRANLISDLDKIGPAAQVVTTLRRHLKENGMPTPTMKRWPLRVELSGYAEILAGTPDTSVLRFIADRVSARGADTVTPAQLKIWLRDWPWLLLLDGFDEVVSPTVREAMINRISDFMIEAASVNAR